MVFVVYISGEHIVIVIQPTSSNDIRSSDCFLSNHYRHQPIKSQFVIIFIFLKKAPSVGIIKTYVRTPLLRIALGPVQLIVILSIVVHLVGMKPLQVSFCIITGSGWIKGSVTLQSGSINSKPRLIGDFPPRKVNRFYQGLIGFVSGLQEIRF